MSDVADEEDPPDWGCLDSIMESLRRGDFLSSSGPDLTTSLGEDLNLDTSRMETQEKSKRISSRELLQVKAMGMLTAIQNK